MINSVYGKTIENLSIRINVRLVNNEKDFLKYASRATYVTHKLCDKGYAAITFIKIINLKNFYLDNTSRSIKSKFHPHMLHLKKNT